MRRGRVWSLLAGLTLVPIAFVTTARAHCPLCTAGAGGAAAFASALGVGLEVVGIFVGAFAVATGFWTASYVSERYVRYQKGLIVVGIYLSIVLPILPLMGEYTGIFVSIAGEYGSVLNRTYLLNTYLVGALFGGTITATTPRLSRALTGIRGSTIPFQGLALTFGLLVLIAGVLQLLLPG